MSTLEAESTREADETILLHHFDDLDQQHDSSILGMWAFLATEVMFFGGLFTAYTVYRLLYMPEFILASRRLDVMYGAFNTWVLLTSSLTMALAVRAAQMRRREHVVIFLLLTMFFGTLFLGIKAIEWYHDYREHLIPGLNYNFTLTDPRYNPAHVELFFVIYFFMTGLHAIHLIIGIAMLGIFAILVWRRWFSGGGAIQIEVGGLYWHFIDVIWVFLYPLLYLIDVRKS